MYDEDMIERLRDALYILYDEFYFLRDKLNKFDLENFDAIYSRDKEEDLASALLKLTNFLRKYYKKDVIVLIDGYDAPLLSAYKHGYYEEAVDFFILFYSCVLKTNPYLRMGVLTGITKVDQTGIFSGLNNIEIYTILDKNYNEYFGLLESEVEKSLEYYGLEDKLEEVKYWYDGYRFGETDVYNPWSILKFLKFGELKAYWVDTSDDFKIKEYINELGADLLEELVSLLEGKSIDIEILGSMTLVKEEKMNTEEFWQLMLFSGYLTVKNKISNTEYNLRLPNEEVRSFFKRKFIDVVFGERKAYKV